MERNPYTPPASRVESQERAPEVPESVLRKIRHGWIVALISGAMTLLLTLVAIFGTDFTGFVDVWNFMDVALIFGLAFGIYKKSRIASTAMFVYFVLSKIYVWFLTEQVSGLLVAAIFIFFFFQAMVGTFQYHKLAKGA